MSGPDRGLATSWSTNDLSSRLYPENPVKKTGKLSATASAPGLIPSTAESELKPKVLLSSQSTSSLKTSKSISKVERLRAEILPSHGGKGLKSTSISTAKSQALLLNEGGIRREHESSEDRKDHQNSSSEICDVPTSLVEAPTNKITTFLESLSLSPKQYYDLMNVPQTFFYLKIREELPARTRSGLGSIRPISASGSVYDLDLVEQKDINKNCYFTLSKEGVTFFRNKVSTFTALAQWNREYILFHKISSIRFFRLYKRWKVIKI